MRKDWLLRFLVVGLLMLLPQQVFACGFDGEIKYTDNSKISHGVRITTSWNSQRAEFPRDGYYFLDLGPRACGKKIELFVNGTSMGKYNVPTSGKVRVDVTMKGKHPVK